MCPFFRLFRRLPGDFRCVLQCLFAAVLVMTAVLPPFAAEPADEPAIPAALDLSLCAFSDDLELELLARVLAAEAGERSYAAQTALGAVLLNRLTDPRFPGNLGAVIGDAGLRAAAGAIPSRSLRAARAALMGVDPTHGAVNWGGRDKVDTVTAEFDGILFGE